MKNFDKTVFSLALLLYTGLASAQIPNAGFEDWTNLGAYNNPVGWQTLNDYTAEISQFTCTKGTPGNPGGSFIKLTSKGFKSFVFTGIAVAGQLDVITTTPYAGYPFTDRPEKLTGNWQHMIFGSSQGYIDVFLTRWDATLNARVPVASKHEQLSGMAMSWENFEIPLNYTDDGNPDSCMIVMSASGDNPTHNDYLWIDNLAFQGSVGIQNIAGSYVTIEGYPNPANHQVSFRLNAKNNEQVRCVISNQVGAIVRNERMRIVNDIVSLKVEELNAGIYIVQFYYSDKKELARIVVE